MLAIEMNSSGSPSTVKTRWRGLSLWWRLGIGWTPFVLGMLWFTETFQTSHRTFSAVLVPLPMWLALGVGEDGFGHDWDEDKVPQVVWFGAAAGLLMVMPLGQVIVGVLMAGAMGCSRGRSPRSDSVAVGESGPAGRSGDQHDLADRGPTGELGQGGGGLVEGTYGADEGADEAGGVQPHELVVA